MNKIFTERAHLFNPSITIIMKLTVDGMFDERRFETALQTLKHVHSLLYACVCIADDGKAYYRENAVERLELRYARREYKEQWLDVAQAENKRPFDFMQEALARIFIFYGENDFDILAVVHHMVGDGDSIARLICDVVKAYSLIEIPFQEQRLLSRIEDFPPEAKPTFMVKAFANSLNKLWHKGSLPRFGISEYKEMFHNYHQSVDNGLAYTTINAEQLTSFHKTCKTHGVTINGAIITAFLSAMREHCSYHKNSEIIVGVPVNIRKQLSFSTEDCLGNFASAFTIKGRYDAKKYFWVNARLVQRLIRKKLSSTKAIWVNLNLYAMMEPLLIDAMYFAAYGECEDKAARKAAAMLAINDTPQATAVSNLGNLNFDSKIGSYHIRDMVFFPPKAPFAYLTLGIATLNRVMQIGFSYDRKRISTAYMDEICAKLTKLIKQEC